MKPAPILLLILSLLALVVLSSCGGGGGSPSSSVRSTPPPLTLAITTSSALPGALLGHAYTTTLAATGGVGALHWSMEPFAGVQTPDGLSFDANTGVIAGTPTFNGTASFTIMVSDSSVPPQTYGRRFTLTASSPLSVAATGTATNRVYSSAYFQLDISGGVQPVTWSFDPSCVPPGMKPGNGKVYPIMSGTPLRIGTYQCLITVQDSYSPPEVLTQLLTIIIEPASLRVADSLPTKISLNRPFSGRIIAVGGIPPYSFALDYGTAPPGLNSIDANTGEISGTPTTAGYYYFAVGVTDSDSPAKHGSESFYIEVSQSVGRNDSPATATAIGNGTFYATISPYIDPPNGTPAAGDNDFYKLVSLGGATVRVEAGQSLRLLDTVVEIVDDNGRQFSTCRQPGDTSTNFNGPCINDDNPYQNWSSTLDFKVPGAADVATMFYIHVLDWRGDARPDMTYYLTVSGVLPPP